MNQLTTCAVARRLGIRADTVRQMAVDGQIPFEWGETGANVRCRLFSESAVADYAARQRARLATRLAALEGAA